MLSVFFGDMPDAIYNTSVYFQNQYRDDWLTKPLSKEIIQDVDKSEVVSANLIDSPVLGAISPKELSGGVKTLLLMANDKSGKVFNAVSYTHLDVYKRQTIPTIGSRSVELKLILSFSETGSLFRLRSSLLTTPELRA